MDLAVSALANSVADVCQYPWPPGTCFGPFTTFVDSHVAFVNALQHVLPHALWDGYPLAVQQEAICDAQVSANLVILTEFRRHLIDPGPPIESVFHGPSDYIVIL